VGACMVFEREEQKQFEPYLLDLPHFIMESQAINCITVRKEARRRDQNQS